MGYRSLTHTQCSEPERNEMGWAENDIMLAGCLGWASRVQILRLVVLGSIFYCYLSHVTIFQKVGKKVSAQD